MFECFMLKIYDGLHNSKSNGINRKQEDAVASKHIFMPLIQIIFDFAFMTKHAFFLSLTMFLLRGRNCVQFIIVVIVIIIIIFRIARDPDR
jgi:hypothetical protein